MSDLRVLDDLSVVVTGAGRGIGQAIALGAARLGAKVSLLARSADQLSVTVDGVRELSREAAAFPCDIRDSETVGGILDDVEQRFGQIYGLVNAAGISPTYTRAERIADSDWDAIVETNLLAPVALCRMVGERMRKAGGGSIVNVTSVGGLVALPRLAAYCASKGGLTGATRTLAAAWREDGVRVNCVAPSYVRTAMSEGLVDHAELGQDIVRRTPMGRLGELDEVAYATLFLLSPASGRLTGQTLCVDGGWTAV